MQEIVDMDVDILPVQMTVEVQIINDNPRLRHRYTYTVGANDARDNEIGEYLSELLIEKMERPQSLRLLTSQELRRQNQAIQARRRSRRPLADDEVRHRNNINALARFGNRR
jgi:hypothetical protein